MEKPQLSKIRDAFAVKKGYKDWESLMEFTVPSVAKVYVSICQDLFDEAEEDFEDYLEREPVTMEDMIESGRRKHTAFDRKKAREEQEMAEALEADQKKLDNLQACIPKEHSLDVSKLDNPKCAPCPEPSASVCNRVCDETISTVTRPVFDISKQYETVCGFEVKIGLVHEGIIYGWAKHPKSWEPMWWLEKTLDLCDNAGELVTYPVFERDGSGFVLREKKARKQISHTFYVSRHESGFCYDKFGANGEVNQESIDNAFAEVTVNVEVQEGDKLVITK